MSKYNLTFDNLIVQKGKIAKGFGTTVVPSLLFAHQEIKENTVWLSKDYAHNRMLRFSCKPQINGIINCNQPTQFIYGTFDFSKKFLSFLFLDCNMIGVSS